MPTEAKILSGLEKSTVRTQNIYHPITHPLEEDINFRIRSLLISRNRCYPPRTPYPSDETSSKFFSYYNSDLLGIGALRPDSFSSIRRSNRKDYINRSTSDSVIASSRDIPGHLNDDRLIRSKKKSVRGTTPVQQELATVSISNKSEKEVSKSLMLGKTKSSKQNKSNRNDIKSSSGFGFHSTGVPTVENLSQNSKYQSQDFQDFPFLKSIIDTPKSPSPALHITSCDLACFVGGCYPGHFNCKKHNTKCTRSAVLEDTKYQGLEFQNKVLLEKATDILSEGRQINRLPEVTDLPKSKIISGLNKVGRSGIDKNSESVKETINERMASGSIDTFSHTLRSLKIAMEKNQEPPYSTTIKTNFSLPSAKPKLKESMASKPGDLKPQDELENSVRVNFPKKEVIRREKSEISFKSKPKSPSILSAASRKSARHSLLKASLTDTRPIEIGLALPPVLSPMPRCLTDVESVNSVNHVKEDLEDTQLESSETLPSVSPSTNFKELEFADCTNMTRSSLDQCSKVIAPTRIVGATNPKSLADVCYYNHGNSKSDVEMSPEKISPANTTLIKNIYVFSEKEEDENTQEFLKKDVSSHDEAANISDILLNASSRNEHPQSLETELKTIAQVEPLKSERAWWKDDSCRQKFSENHVLSSLQPNISVFKDPENQSQRNTNFGKNSTKNQRSERFDALISINTETGANRSKLEKTDHKKIRNRTDLDGYTAIPTRDSTKTFVLSPILASPDSISDNNPTYESFQRNIGSEKNAELRSMSSAESFVNSKSEIKDHDHTDLIHLNPLEICPIGPYKNTVFSLKNLLPGISPSENLLTALPSRTLQEHNFSHSVKTDIEAQHAVSEFPINRNSEQPKQEMDIMKSKFLKSERNSMNDIFKAFVNSINDLETLMSEALSIARQAADPPDPTIASSVPENTIKTLNSDHPSSSVTWHENSQIYLDENQTYHSDETQVFRPKKKEDIHSIIIDATDCTEGEFNHLSKLKNPPPRDSKALGSNSPRYRLTKSSDSSVNQRVEGLNRSDANFSQDENYTRRANLRSLNPHILEPNYTSETRKNSELLPRAIEQVNMQLKISNKNARSKFSKKSWFSKRCLNDQVDKIYKKRDLKAGDLKKHRTKIKRNLDNLGRASNDAVDFSAYCGPKQLGASETGAGRFTKEIELQDYKDRESPRPGQSNHKKQFSLSGKTHISLKESNMIGFSPTKIHKRHPIARDWSTGRKRLVATAACFSTALIGILVGIYAGETPAIQYYIADLHHYTVLGNVFFFFGLAIPTFFAWPLPLLHGRKPYILIALSLAMPLIFPQALAVGDFRSPYISHWRVGLLLSRTMMGFCLGFANINFKCMLTDLFGASLQSTNPHQEHVDEFDVRRHGGGMGVWLGLWTWSALGSIGLGFLIGASIIETLPPSWGFYISIIIIAFVMLLNIVCPEVRSSAYRRSVTKIVTEEAVSHRLARGEIKMHMVKVGPKWWGEELQYGIKLSQKMLRQPGFLIMSLYVAWIYGQQVLIILLLGALISHDYHLRSPLVGLCVMAIPLGALVAIPFQKASLFSRSRRNPPLDDDGTVSKKKIYWSSHMLRRAIFVLFLPIFGLLVTLTTSGPPVPLVLPVLGSGFIGFLSNLAIAECHGIIMETFDTSDLEPYIHDHLQSSLGSRSPTKLTNYSSFPRVSSAFAITETFGYIFAAGASGIGGVLTRKLGRQAAIGVMASVLLVLSLLLLGVLVRFTEVQIIPDSKIGDMNRYQARRASYIQRGDVPADDEETWRPIIIGNPHQSTRRMCILEFGSLSRFSEIRMKNKLIDEMSLEARHPNRNAMNSLERRIKEKEAEILRNLRRSISRSSRGNRRSENPETSAYVGRWEFLSAEVDGNRHQKNSSYNRERKISE
ncbi:hypothetical protein GcC1_078008 [Golovinomyces cichoracearum]|uniref:Uncharacterized protein n=1 Tax=Golovinomyces cichoracearum TaxID=62708 RepID=A0A420IM07_9PEZI|nr:hypothetical protein GcC1_078008 [Golovinomyces cichoracearum]